MYHLLRGLHEYLTRRDTFSIVIIGLDNAGKTTFLERIKNTYNNRGAGDLDTSKIGPTIGQNMGKINLPSTELCFFDLGGQRDIRSIWEKYYDECHAVVFVVDASDQARLSEGWEVFNRVLNSPRLLNLPLLLLANKQDSPSALSVSEIRESFEAWQRASVSSADDDGDRAGGVGIGEGVSERERKMMWMGMDAMGSGGGTSPGKPASNQPSLPLLAAGNTDNSTYGNGQVSKTGTAAGPSPDSRPDFERPLPRRLSTSRSAEWDDGGAAKAERLASLDVLGISALTGEGVKDAVDWLYTRVQTARRIEEKTFS